VNGSGRLIAIAVLAGAAVAACQGSSKTANPVTCKTFASAEELCDTERCIPVWSAVETNRAFCASCAYPSVSAGDCGDYHVLDSIGVDSGAMYYYRRDTGTLVYAQFFSAPGTGNSCSVVGTAAFSPPSCASAAFSSLPGWCSPDAGAAGERVFPCCRNTIASCNFNGVCPATWSEAQAVAPSLCDGQTTRTNPELDEPGSCGGDHLFRYWYGTTQPFTLYYDASGALVAGIDETSGRCDFGPVAGLTLPACDAPLASACPDGGGAP
jgi:hypothetical protein